MKGVDITNGELVDVKFFTQWIVPAEVSSEKEDHSSMTETAYVPPQVQIADMMLAGLRLAEERRARFDSVELGIEGDGDIPLDPTREPGVDVVDLQKSGATATEALEAIQRIENRRAKEKADAEQKAVFEKAVSDEIEARQKAVKTA